MTKEKCEAFRRADSIYALIKNRDYTQEEAAALAATAATNLNVLFPSVPVADIEAYILDK